MKKKKKKKKSLPTSEPRVRKNFTCLLVRVNQPKVSKTGGVKDHFRHFFTPKKNLRYLAEFAKAFGAEISEVKLVEGTVLPLRHLAEAFCDSSYNDGGDFEIISQQIPTQQAPKPKDKKVVCKKIRTKLLTGKSISTQDLYTLLEDCGFCDSTIRQYFTTVRSDLADEGYYVERVGRGTYKVH